MPTCLPDRAVGALAKLAVVEESPWGTPASGHNPIGIEFVAETLGLTIATTGLLHRQNSGRAPILGIKSNHDVSGDISGEVQLHGAFPFLLRCALCKTPSSGGSGPYTHVMSGSDQLQDGITIEKAIGFRGGSYKYFRYHGCVIDTMSVRIPTEGTATWRAVILGSSEERPGSPLSASPAYVPKNDPVISAQATLRADLTGGGSLASVGFVKTVDLSIENDYNKDDYRVTTGPVRAGLLPGNRKTSGSMQVALTSQAHQLYENGYLSDLPLSLELKLTRGIYSATFSLPSIQIQGSPGPRTPDRTPMVADVPFVAGVGAGGTDIVVTLVNSDRQLTTAP